MKHTRVARRYAQALIGTAESPKTIDAIANDLETVKALYDGSRELRLLVHSPVVSAEKKIQIFRELFGKQVGTTTMAFLEMLIVKQREAALAEITEQYNALRDEKYGIVTVDVSSAVEVAPAQQKDLSSKLEQYTKKKVRVRFSLDKALMGGLVVKIGDTVLDASIKRQLELMRERFVHGHSMN